MKVYLRYNIFCFNGFEKDLKRNFNDFFLVKQIKFIEMIWNNNINKVIS